MHLSILLRVAVEPLDDGRVCGRAEIVETGETSMFRDADQLIRFVQSVVNGPRAEEHDPPTTGAAAEDRTM